LEYLFCGDFVIADKCPKVLWQTLTRKGLITESKEISPSGKELREKIFDPDLLVEKVEKTSRKDYDSKFLEWLSHYPATAAWQGSNGKQWVDTRILRKASKEAENKYLSILESGEYTQEELIKALEFQVYMCKKDSQRTGLNKMIYFQGTLPYLNQQTYKTQVETMKKFKWAAPIENKEQREFNAADSMLI
jgi:hypothetical protein